MIPSIPKRSLRNLAIFAGTLAAVVGILVIPSYFAIGRAEKARTQIGSQLNAQRQLAPVFGKLVKKRGELKAASTEMPERAALGRDEAGNVSDMLTRLAGNNRLQMIGITSDLNAMVNDAKQMQVDIVLRGGLENYRQFLEQLIRVPHLEFIERLRITAIPAGREYGMRVWIALK